jgi:hypothetical protein
MASWCSCFPLFNIHRSAYGFSDATTNKRVRAFLFLWRTEKFLVTFYLFSGRETTTREHWFHVSFFFCTWICSTLPCKVWWEFNLFVAGRRDIFLGFSLACRRHPLNGQRMPGSLYHAQSGSSTEEEILQKNVLLYLIENTFDARPTTSFAFHVLFRLWSVARTTANGFGWRRPVSPKSQLCFRI